jgi:hypothetical protein
MYKPSSCMHVRTGQRTVDQLSEKTEQPVVVSGGGDNRKDKQHTNAAQDGRGEREAIKERKEARTEALVMQFWLGGE